MMNRRYSFFIRPSASSISEPHIPGSYEDDQDKDQDESPSNIRYGRIPRRVLWPSGSGGPDG